MKQCTQFQERKRVSVSTQDRKPLSRSGQVIHESQKSIRWLLDLFIAVFVHFRHPRDASV